MEQAIPETLVVWVVAQCEVKCSSLLGGRVLNSSVCDEGLVVGGSGNRYGHAWIVSVPHTTSPRRRDACELHCDFSSLRALQSRKFYKNMNLV